MMTREGGDYGRVADRDEGKNDVEMMVWPRWRRVADLWCGSDCGWPDSGRNLAGNERRRRIPRRRGGGDIALILDLLHQLYMKMKTDPQAQATDSGAWNALKAKESKTTSSEKPKQQEYDVWFEIPEVDDDEVISEDATPKFMDELKSFDKKESMHKDLMILRKEAYVFYGLQRNPNESSMYLYNKELIYLKNRNTKEKKYVLSPHKIHATSFLENDLKERLTRWRFYITKQRKERSDLKEVFLDHKIGEVVRITTGQKYGTDFMEEIIVKRDENKLYTFLEADFKNLNKDDIEDMYYLCLNGKVKYHENGLLNSLIVFLRSYFIWERVHDYHLRIMSLTEIEKFCDAMLEKVLKEVSLKIVESRYKLKTPSLGDLDKMIMKAFERDKEASKAGDDAILDKCTTVKEPRITK
nr:hypothetical protein [Tanacetum cinerariifolium]